MLKLLNNLRNAGGRETNLTEIIRRQGVKEKGSKVLIYVVVDCKLSKGLKLTSPKGSYVILLRDTINGR